MNSTKLLLLSLTLLAICISRAYAQSDESSFQITTGALDQWETVYDEELGESVDAETMEGGGASNRRSLFWGKKVHYYISYGALSANRVPCPPRSGRSYYTHNCYNTRAPVHPYTRGCSAITRCRR